jgi:hypothetical protein
MSVEAGSIEAHIRDLASGGWEALDAFLDRDPVAKATSTRDTGLTDDDKRDIQTAWAAFAATPGGHKALQALVDRTLNRTVYYSHLGLPLEQIAIYGAGRESQNFIVQLILNMIRLAREEPPKQRDV